MCHRGASVRSPWAQRGVESNFEEGSFHALDPKMTIMPHPGIVWASI